MVIVKSMRFIILIFISILLFQHPAFSADLIFTDDLGQYSVNWYNPNGTEISDLAPSGVVMPVFSGNEQRYGTIAFGDSIDPNFHFAVDLFGTNENMHTYKFYFDRNKNNDLTDDGGPWEAQGLSSVKIPAFNIPYSNGKNRPFSFEVYAYFADWDLNYHVAYYRDCGWTGMVSISPGIYRHILLLDNNADGIYNTTGLDMMIVDINDDDILDGSHLGEETIKHFDAFLISDAAYALDTVAVDGTDVTFKSVPFGFLTGTIQSNTGTPLYGAKVEAVQSINHITYTDSNGFYSMAPPLGQWNLRYSLYGYIPAYGNVTISENQSTFWNVDLVPIPYPNSGTITLFEGDSYDFATGDRGKYLGGDFYYSVTESSFLANNLFQRGVLDLGIFGNTALTEIDPPESGYTSQGVDAVVGHTYVSLARQGEEGCFIAFKVMSMNSNSITIDYNFIMKGDPLTLPTIYTNAVESIMLTSAISGGYVASDGGATVSEKGICWSTSPSPSILDSKSVSGAGTGAFSSLISELTPGTTYYVRAYATNIAGTGYGTPISFTTSAPTRIINLNGSLSFGDVYVGTTHELTFTIGNSGNSPLNVSSINYPAGFSGDWTGGSISANSSRSITVTFTPMAATTYGGTIVVNCDKTSGINTLQISGTGKQQTRIMDITGSLTFGDIDINTTKKLPFTITNNGNTNLAVGSIEYPAGFTGNWSDGTIIAGYSQSITVTFKPTAAQVYSGIITVNSDMTSGTNSISVSGAGIQQSVFHTISGYIKDANNNGINGVTLIFSNGKGSALTDATGFYSKILDSGWTGIATPSKSGISFTPPSRSYSNLSSDWNGQDYAGGVPPASFRIWIDKNGNNIYDTGEGISGASVRVNNETADRGITDAQGIILIPNISNADKLFVQKMIFEMNNPKAVDSNFTNSRNNNPYYAGSVNGKMYQFVMASDIMADDGTYQDFPGQGKTLLDVPKDPQGNMLVQLVHPKIQWNLIVAFEEAQSTMFYEQIKTAFKSYADYMYNFTDGIFVVKNVVLVKGAYIDTPQWDYCDVQIKNLEWPNAHIFGNRYNYKSHIHIGKEWGNASPDQYNWYSTLGHESGHYLLGFGDEYMNGNYTKGYTKGAKIPWTYRSDHDGDPGEPNEFPANYGVMQYQYGGVHEISDTTDYFPRTYFSSMDPDLVTHQFMSREGLSCWIFFKSYYENEIKQKMMANGLTDYSDAFFNNLIDPPHQTGSYPGSNRTKRPGPEFMNHDQVNFIEWTFSGRRRYASKNENVFDAYAIVLDENDKAVVDADVWLVSSDRVSFQGKTGRDGSVKCGSLLPGKYLETYHNGIKTRLMIDEVKEKYILTLPLTKSVRRSSSNSSSGMVIIAKPGISDYRHLMVTASGSGLNIAPEVTLSQSHGYAVDIPMIDSGINKYTGSGDCQYDSGVLQVSLGTNQSVSPFVIYSTDMGPASGYYAPNSELEITYSSETFDGSGSFIILNSSTPAPPNFGMIQIGNVYSFGFSDTILSVRDVILNIKLPESGRGANLNLFGWDINNSMWIEIPGGVSNQDYFSISLASLMDYSAYALFAMPQANDPVPPESVTDFLATTGDTFWDIDLQWALPNDNDLSALDIRFNTKPISTENWEQCISISKNPEPTTPGAVQYTTVEMPDPGVMYYFGIMAIDVSGNVSPLTTLSNPVMSHAADADGDGIPDLWETSNGLNPFVSDAANDDDGDMIINLVEYQYRTDPNNSDTDGDGYSDSDEISQGTNPDNFESFPNSSTITGDLDCDGALTLSDAIVALKILTSVNLSVVCNNYVNNDGQIGLDEVIYILQEVAELR